MSQKMRHDEWLPQAKKLPIGQSKRIYHGNETRPNLVIQNHGDRWSAYCHRCHCGGLQRKEHAVLAPVQQKRIMPWPADAINIMQAPQHIQHEVASFLATKNMDIRMCFDTFTYYSESQRRLLFYTQQGWLGRAMNGVQPKWIAYSNFPPRFGIHPNSTCIRDNLQFIILTEDYLSTIKIIWATDYYSQFVNCPLAVLGSSLSNELIKQLLPYNVPVLGFFDGDDAGIAGDIAAALRLRGLGIDYRSVKAPPGKDPKDLHAADLHNLIRDAYYGVANTSGAT
jgi:hypothetical protein